MTQDEIIEMAATAYESCNHIPDLKVPREFIFNFAKLIVAKEREARKPYAWARARSNVIYRNKKDVPFGYNSFPLYKE